MDAFRSRFVRRLKFRLRRVARAFEDWILPPLCLYCAGRRHGGLPLCLACLHTLCAARPEEDEAVTGLPWTRALFRLTPPLHGLIHALKYRHAPGMARFLAAWLRMRPAWRADLAVSYDALLPVPLHAARRRERGYNQAEALARALGRLGGIRVEARALRRVRHTGSQTFLGGRARARNLDGAFRADTARVFGGRFLLVDDVCTTGSTLSHCREELLRAGAARVDALVVAWVEPARDPPLPDFGGLEVAAGFFG